MNYPLVDYLEKVLKQTEIDLSESLKKSAELYRVTELIREDIANARKGDADDKNN